jgi:nucleoside-diphosphate-sugar epimerase
MPYKKTLWIPTLDQEDLDHILNKTSSLWDELCGQRLFMTGGTGFFGHWLLESFLWVNDHLDLNMEALLLSRNPENFRNRFPQLGHHPAVSWIKGDVKTFEFPDGDFPCIIHAASEGDYRLAQQDPLAVFNTIVDGTHRVLEFARTHHTRKLLFTSSGAVYGKQPLEMTHIPEDYLGGPDVSDPSSAYGEGKRAAEQLCTLYSHQYGFETKIARCFAFVGPYLPLDANYAIGNFIRDALKGGPIVIKGDGTTYRSYLYVADLVIWIWKILFQGHPCSLYNVGSEEIHSIFEIAERVAAQFPGKAQIKVLGTSDQLKTPEYYIPNVDRAKFELGLEIWIPLEIAIQKTIAYYQKSR